KRSGHRLAVEEHPSRPGQRMVAELLREAEARAADGRLPESVRQEAVRLLGCGPFARGREAMSALLDPKQPEGVQVAAVRALADLTGYADALKLKGDARLGREVFRKNCMVCHRLGGEGVEVGPNLTSSSFRDPGALMVQIFDPNQYVLPKYVQYLLADRNGRT